METIQIVVPFEITIEFARVPVSRRAHTVQQRPVVQHREVETAAVPGHQHRRVFLDAFKEASDDFRLVRARIADRPDAQLVGVAQHHRDRDHPMQMVTQKLGITGFFAAFMKHDLRHVGVAQSFKIVQATAGGNVRNGFNIKYKDVHLSGSVRKNTSRKISVTAIADNGDDYSIAEVAAKAAAPATVAPPDEMPQKMPSSRASRRVMSSASACDTSMHPIDTRCVVDLRQVFLRPGADTGNLRTFARLHTDDLNC